jgi:integrase
MGMPRRRKGARVNGPYEHCGGYRVREVEADGSSTWSPTFATEAEALAYKEGIEGQITSGELTVQSALELYEEYLTAKGNKKDSKRQTLWSITQFFPEDTPLWVLRPLHFEKRYLELTKKFSVASHRGMLAQVKTFLDWCVEKKWMKSNPAAGVKGMGKRNKRKTQLSRKEAKDWFDVAMALANKGDDGAVAALIAMLMGLRASEITCLKVRHLDDSYEPCDSLWVTDSKTEAGIRQLEVPRPLIPVLCRMVEDRLPEEWLFPTSKGKDGKHWRDWPNIQVQRICDLSGVTTVTCHGMRGLVATMTLRSGADVSSYLGHTDHRTTDEHYAMPGAREEGLRKIGMNVLLRRRESVPAQVIGKTDNSDTSGKSSDGSHENN